jgi:hypothetical protein
MILRRIPTILRLIPAHRSFRFWLLTRPQQVSSIEWKPFLKLVRATIDKMRGTISMKVDRVHEKFIYHPKNLACCCQI